MSKRFTPAYGGNPRQHCIPSNMKALWADCTTANIPADGVAGYESGCFLQVYDGAANAQFYINTGTKTSCAFKSVRPGTATGTLNIPMEQWKVWDALATNLPGTASADDLGLTTGTFLTSGPTILSVDYGGTTTTAYARRQLSVPADYVAGTNLTLTAKAAMAVISDTTGILDFEVVNHSFASNADICATAATSVNSATEALVPFTLTGSDVTAGDMLDIRMKFTGTDSGNAAPLINVVISLVKLAYTRYQ